MDEFDRTMVHVQAAALARELATDPSVDPGQIAYRIMAGGFDIEAMAWGYAEHLAQSAHRGAVRSREHDAKSSKVTLTKATPAPAAVHESYPWNVRGRSKCEKCGCSKCVAALDEYWEKLGSKEAEIFAQSQQRILDIVQDTVTSRAQEMFAKWTSELLASTFALPDGTRVTWAEATSQQHRDRIEMLNKQAAGTIETAALHERALRDMGQAGVSRLADIKEAA